MDPWYKVASPRKEVREGRSFNPDEFAIALEQVVAGTAPKDYTDPKEFFRRTFLTESLKRLLVGGVFLSEGIQKFLFVSELGVGRFARIGIPAPELMGPFVGAVEIVAGLLVLSAVLVQTLTPTPAAPPTSCNAAGVHGSGW